MIIRDGIREGTYILVKEFVLARANRINGEGEVLYFVLKDFYAIGEDDREKADTPDYVTTINEAMDAEQSKSSSPTDEPKQEQLSHTPIASSKPRPRLVDERPAFSSFAASTEKGFDEPGILEPSDRPVGEATRQLPSSTPEETRAKKRKLEIALGEIDPNLSSPPKKAAKTEGNSNKDTSLAAPTRASSQEHASFNTKTSQPNTERISSEPQLKTASAAARPLLKTGSVANQTVPAKPKAIVRPAPRLPAKRPEPIERALNIIPLARLRGYPRRGDVYDVFVVIQAVGNEVIKRSRMPAKRDLRIVDPSTEKKVLLSIFVEPEKFIPTVGTIALIRSVTTHEWDGGMINAYPNQCEGKQWFVPNPIGVPGCDVDRMREWWLRKQAEEAEKIRQEETNNQDAR
ncbi:MAG: hypothetical protein Q9195_003980 [Heterodermia aff. obscurata]